MIALVPCTSSKSGPVTISHTAKLMCDFEVGNDGGSTHGVNVPNASSLRERYGFKDDSKVYCIVIFHISKLPTVHKLRVTNVRNGWGSVAIEVRFADISNWIQKKTFDTPKSTECALEEKREDTHIHDQRPALLDETLSEPAACKEPRADSVEFAEFLV